MPFPWVPFVLALLAASYYLVRGRKPKKYLRPDASSFALPPSAGTRAFVTNPTAEVQIRLSENGVGAVAPVTVVQRFREAVANHGPETALSVEREGRWITWTWTQYYQEACQAARALIRLGVKPFGSINIIGFNSPEWFFANMGAILCGAKAVGIYTTSNPDACQYIAGHSEASVAVVEDVSQLDKFLLCKKQLPHLRAIVVYTGAVPAGANTSDCPVYSWKEFMALGAEENPELQVRIDAQKPGHVCTLIYTSGTTGPPKAVMLTHDNLTWTASSMMSTMPTEFLSTEGVLVSYLPLSHIAAQLVDIHAPITLCAHQGSRSVCVYFARSDALKGSLGETLKFVRPTLFFGVPRVWEKIYEKMKAVGANTKGVAKAIATFAKSCGTAGYKAQQVGGDGSLPWGWTFSKLVVFNNIKKAIGLDRCVYMISGAAPIPPQVVNYFASLDIPIKEVYGMSECTGPQTLNTMDYFMGGTVGVSLPGCEIKIENTPGRDKPGEGEICYRGRHIMAGYMHNEAKTREAIDSEGWLHSGDVGCMDAATGLVSITGRIKELIIGAGGENIAPVPIEDSLKALCPALGNVMMVGDKRKYNTLLVCPQVGIDIETGMPLDTLIGEAKAVNPAVTTLQEAAKDPVWRAYIQRGLDAVNKQAVSQAARIQKFAFLPRDFSVVGGELTPSMKLKRSVVAEMYAALIQTMYDE